MKYNLKANTIKLMINSFANGNLELVKQFHAQYGNELFEYVPAIRRGNFERLIMYSFKGCYWDVIDYYLSQPGSIPPKGREIYIICRGAAKPGRFKHFISNRSELYKKALPTENVIEQINGLVCQSYNLDLIDEYLETYPQYFESLLKQCSTTAKGKQLRRHLQLKQLVNE